MQTKKDSLLRPFRRRKAKNTKYIGTGKCNTKWLFLKNYKQKLLEVVKRYK